jgi:hypothetical protein
MMLPLAAAAAEAAKREAEEVQREKERALMAAEVWVDGLPLVAPRSIVPHGRFICRRHINELLPLGLLRCWYAMVTLLWFFIAIICVL